MNDEANILLEIIDKRIKKILKEEHICYRYIAKVQEMTTDENSNTIGTYYADSKVPVILLGFEEKSSPYYYFTNRTGVTLFSGDLVYVEAIGNNLNSGVITQVYKYQSQIFIE